MNTLSTDNRSPHLDVRTLSGYANFNQSTSSCPDCTLEILKQQSCTVIELRVDADPTLVSENQLTECESQFSPFGI